MLRRTCTETIRRVFSSQAQMSPKPFHCHRNHFRGIGLAFEVRTELKCAVEVTLPAIPWVCSMKFFQLSPAPCAEGRSAAAAPWSCALSPSPLHCTSSFQPNMTMSLSSAEAFCLLLSTVCSGESGHRKPLALALCRANKSWHPVDHHWQPCMRWDEASEESGPFIVYLFHSHRRSWLGLGEVGG